MAPRAAANRWRSSRSRSSEQRRDCHWWWHSDHRRLAAGRKCHWSWHSDHRRVAASRKCHWSWHSDDRTATVRCSDRRDAKYGGSAVVLPPADRSHRWWLVPAALTLNGATHRITGLSPGVRTLVWRGRLRVSLRTSHRGQGRESSGDLAGVHRLQGAHVQHPQEQEERPSAPGAQQVLPPLPATHAAPGDQVTNHGRKPSRLTGVGRGVAQLVEHWSPKPAVAGSSPVAPASTRRATAQFSQPVQFPPPDGAD